MTLQELAAAIGKAPSQVSLLENGKREPTVARLQAVAHALDASIDELLSPDPPSRRDALEIELERVQRGPLFDALGIAAVRVGRGVPLDALEAIVALQRELERLHSQRALTPEEARRANRELREEMRARDNYYPELEAIAARLLAGVDHRGGPVSYRKASDLAAYLGFDVHSVPDVPRSTRSVIDKKNRRLYLPSNGIRGRSDGRSALLQALASHVLDHEEPTDYRELLRQRVEANYLCAALLLNERDAVGLLREAKARRAVSIDEFRDAFAVSSETAAHRFTNLATAQLGIPVHFMKVHESGIIHKAYENDGVRFPADALGAVEGQYVCKHWTARVVFDLADRLAPYSQYTDTPNGTYWCTSYVDESADGAYSVSVGVPYAGVKWFVGRDTTARSTSTCPDPECCSLPPAELAQRWSGKAFPSARPHVSLLAAMPQGAMPGVDATEVYEFLDRHAPSSS